MKISIIKEVKKTIELEESLPYYFLDVNNVWDDESEAFGVVTEKYVSFFSITKNKHAMNDNYHWHNKHNGSLSKNDSWMFKSNVKRINKDKYEKLRDDYISFINSL